MFAWYGIAPLPSHWTVMRRSWYPMSLAACHQTSPHGLNLGQSSAMPTRRPLAVAPPTPTPASAATATSAATSFFTVPSLSGTAVVGRTLPSGEDGRMGRASYPATLFGLPRKQRVHETLRAEAHRIACGQPGLVLRLGDRPEGILLTEVARVQCNREDPRGPCQQAHALVQVDELRERRDREPLVAVDDGVVRLVAEDVAVGRRAVDETEGDTRVRGMQERSLPLDEDELAPATHAFQHELLGGPRNEVGDHGVDGDPPPRDRDPRLTRRDELASHATPARFAIELERHRHLPDRAVGADGEDHARGMRQVLAGRDVEPGRRLAQVA